VNTTTAKFNRRRFLKLAGVAGALALPTLLGYDLLCEAQGELPPSLSPYAPSKVLESWPAEPTAASPILLLIHEQAQNPFGLYLAEILRAEGLNCFQVAYLSQLERAPLAWFDQVLLAEGPLNNGQAELLESYVMKGGRLVAMRPDARLAALFGLERRGGSTAEGYLQVAADHPVGQGIASETLQFHGTADHYRLVGAETIAWLASDAETCTGFPALTIHTYGQGQAALWAFDLARSIAYTRQGNLAWANQERDGFFAVRAPDMFKGWIDLDRLAIPQADQQQRLLANLMGALSQGTRPLPRLWYFPGAVKTIFIATTDAHQSSASAIEEVLARVEQRGGHISIYYAPPLQEELQRAISRARFLVTSQPLLRETLVQHFRAATPAHIAQWRAQGHEFALHPYVGCNDRICAYYLDDILATPDLATGWRRFWQQFTGLGYGPVPPTVRTHCVLWTGWVETARLQATYGIRMNLDYYHIGPSFQQKTGEWVYGHFTGSGLPMKFVDEQGRILNIYQQLTQLADDHLLNLQWGGQVKLSAEAAVAVSKILLQRSLAGDHSAIAANFHTDPFDFGGQPAAEAARWLEGTLDYAADQGIPIWSALEWLHYTEARHDANLEGIEWQPGTKRLNFRLAVPTATDVDLAVMIPLRHGSATLSQVEVDGFLLKHHERKVAGVDYGWVSLKANSCQIAVTYA
jgi:hypothetical protein